MARDTADTTLVQGAYAAAGGNIQDYGLAASKAMSALGTDLLNQTAAITKERRDRFEKFADYELARNAESPTPEDHDILEKKLRKRKNQFVW